MLVNTPGGGGYGRPEERPGGLIERDLSRGYLTREQAEPSIGAGTGGERGQVRSPSRKTPASLLIDDARGRRTARSREIPAVGVAGVLLAAKSRGELSAVGPVLDRLSNVGYRLSPRLVAGTLLRARE